MFYSRCGERERERERTGTDRKDRKKMRSQVIIISPKIEQWQSCLQRAAASYSVPITSVIDRIE
jgi:hypothetical protein